MVARLILTVAASIAALAAGCDGSATTTRQLAVAHADLPDVGLFEAHPSDRFPVDIEQIAGGHPYMGVNSDRPHAGAHLHFENVNERWPKNGDPSDYPAIYAVADGVVSRVDHCFHLGEGNDRYGLDLAFAKGSTGAAYHFCYSIEPMVGEPSQRFYERFIHVRQGERVRKGDVIAHMYSPPGANGTHVHFHLTIEKQNGFLAPAIFTPAVVEEFHAKCNGFRAYNGGTTLPACMGYRITAEENPFRTGPMDRL